MIDVPRRCKLVGCPGHGLMCFYCNQQLSRRHEHDHFPVPARWGGDNLVPTCHNCHDWKDRVGIDNWGEDRTEDAFVQCLAVVCLLEPQVRELHSDTSRGYPRGLGLYLKTISKNFDLHERYPALWQALSPTARIFWAVGLYQMLDGYAPETEANVYNRADRVSKWTDPLFLETWVEEALQVVLTAEQRKYKRQLGIQWQRQRFASVKESVA